MHLRGYAICALLTFGHANIALADADSSAAINAVGLKRPDGVVLTGSRVNVGHVDVSRAPVPGFDSPANTHPSVVPVESRNSNGQLPSGADDGLLDSHGVRTASIIIGDGNTGPIGVAPGASLYSAGFIAPFIATDADLLTAQYIAKRYSFGVLGIDGRPRHIRAINHSWGGTGFSGSGPYSGNDRLTLGMDWIASKFDVLNVIAGPYDNLADDPTANFNGVTVAFTSKSDSFRRVAQQNDNTDAHDADGERVSVDLLAPGEGVERANGGGGTITTLYGTSIAAPHVTGAVALLNEYGDYQAFEAFAPRWDTDNTRKHEVMKAILLNSADKVIVDEEGNSWENSAAYFSDTMSLDQQLGAGLLDTGRALRQFASGEYNNGESIPPIGWDYGEVGGPGTTLVYPFAAPLSAGKVTITLAWDRGVTKSGGLDNTFDPTNIFTGQGVDNLDLFLMPVGWTNLYNDSIATWRSWSTEDNVEHIYADVLAGEYEIVVFQADGVDRDFGLAWWTGNPADFNQDGVVNASDLSQWKFDFGPSPESDADFDGDSDGNDFLAWQRNLGAGAPAVPVSQPVPEPGATLLLGLAMPLLFMRKASS